MATASPAVVVDEAAVVAAAETEFSSPNLSLNDSFWQALLAGELSPAKASFVLSEIRAEHDLFGALRAHPALSPAERRRILEAGAFVAAPGRSVIVADDFPESLAESELGYPALIAQGDLAALRAPKVAIVGTRSASTYGKACAQKFGEALAKAGVTVISGGALGIDAAAHKGALAAEGRTVAVLACGVDVVYPAVHASLFQQIEQRGALISQYAIGTKPAEYRFLQRNQLIAALADALLVVEAPAKSGALSTAHAANDLGRDVYVVPANIDQKGFFGSFNLIRDGATLVDHPNQILEAMGIEPRSEHVAESANSIAEQILAVLGVEPMATERIGERTGLATDILLTELTMMELDGSVIRDGGGFAKRP
jgi:DNA processing protein